MWNLIITKSTWFLIISKMNLENDNLCTSQRAFYQFRNAVKTEIIINRNQIKPETYLKTIFPKRNRKKILKRIENQLGYKIEVLAPSQITINILFFSLVISFIGLFINWKIAIFGILISVLGFYLTKFTNRLDKRTVREIIEKNTAQNYFKIRNSENTFNKIEFKDVILEWFSENAGIQPHDCPNTRQLGISNSNG